METKNKIGILVILGGIAVIGIYWFKKNKPTVASNQLKELENLSNFYKTGGGKEETMILENKNPIVSNNSGQLGFGVKGDEIFRNEMDKLNQYSATNIVSNQIAENLKNADFSSLSNLGLAGLTFDTIKK